MSDYLLSAALSSLGIYPAFNSTEGVNTPRDRYGDGWNDAIITLSRRRVLLTDWYSKLSNEMRADLDLLFESECLQIEIEDDQISLSINMNDVFVPAAVSEPIDLSDLDNLASMYVKHGHEGIIAYFHGRYACPPRKGRANKADYAAALADPILRHSS